MTFSIYSKEIKYSTFSFSVVIMSICQSAAGVGCLGKSMHTYAASPITTSISDQSDIHLRFLNSDGTSMVLITPKTENTFIDH